MSSRLDRSLVSARNMPSISSAARDLTIRFVTNVREQIFYGDSPVGYGHSFAERFNACSRRLMRPPKVKNATSSLADFTISFWLSATERKPAMVSTLTPFARRSSRCIEGHLVVGGRAGQRTPWFSSFPGTTNAPNCSQYVTTHDFVLSSVEPAEYKEHSRVLYAETAAKSGT